jgi:hypothetical protein
VEGGSVRESERMREMLDNASTRSEGVVRVSEHKLTDDV